MLNSPHVPEELTPLKYNSNKAREARPALPPRGPRPSGGRRRKTHRRKTHRRKTHGRTRRHR